jgi:hypothetical protein
MATPFRHIPEPDPEDIQDPELRKIVLYLKFKSEQRGQKYLDDLRAPMKRYEERKAREQEPATRQRQEVARKVFR